MAQSTLIADAMGEEEHKLVTEVVKCWQQNEDLCRRAATGKLGNVTKPKNVSRGDVSINCDLLAPILQHFGT